jgi:hypothetical protein
VLGSSSAAPRSSSPASALSFTTAAGWSGGTDPASAGHRGPADGPADGKEGATPGVAGSSGTAAAGGFAPAGGLALLLLMALLAPKILRSLHELPALAPSAPFMALLERPG